MSTDANAPTWAFSQQTRKRRLNGLWVDAVAVMHGLLALLPSPLRNAAWRLVLGSCGRHVFFDRKVYVKYPWLVSIGSSVSVNRGVEFYPDLGSRAGVSIGSDVYLAPHVRFHASGHDLEELERHIGSPIVVGDGCWLGSGVLVMPGATIGANSVVGAGSVVTRDIPPNSIAVGAPARVIRSRVDQD
jgi:maltose O-acetyltransferase